MNGKGVIGVLFTILAWICVLSLVGALFMSGEYFMAEKALAFMPYMAVIFGLGLIFTGGVTRLVNIIFLVVSGFLMIMPLDTETSVTAMPRNRVPYKVIYYNASSTNMGGDSDALSLQAKAPDLLILTGANPENFPSYSSMRNMFSRQYCSYKGEGESSIAVMGNLEIKCKIELFEGYPMAFIEAPDKSMYAANAPLPVDEDSWAKRNAYIKKFGEFIKASGGSSERIVVGSLNISPYSSILKKFMKEHSYMGMESSWKATYYPEKIKYDYTLAYTQENLSKNEIMPKLSSRHKPLFINWN